MSQEKYQPTPEEIKQAEETMTDEQKMQSEARAEGVALGKEMEHRGFKERTFLGDVGVLAEWIEPDGYEINLFQTEEGSTKKSTKEKAFQKTVKMGKVDPLRMQGAFRKVMQIVERNFQRGFPQMYRQFLNVSAVAVRP